MKNHVDMSELKKLLSDLTLPEMIEVMRFLLDRLELLTANHQEVENDISKQDKK